MTMEEPGHANDLVKPMWHYPPRPSSFLEGDFNMVTDDQCQFHRDSKHTMRECEQLKRALVVPSTSKRTRSSNNDDRNGG
jgi:hypothetical protein